MIYISYVYGMLIDILYSANVHNLQLRIGFVHDSHASKYRRRFDHDENPSISPNGRISPFERDPFYYRADILLSWDTDGIYGDFRSDRIVRNAPVGLLSANIKYEKLRRNFMRSYSAHKRIVYVIACNDDKKIGEAKFKLAEYHAGFGKYDKNYYCSLPSDKNVQGYKVLRTLFKDIRRFEPA
jgi:hypothetical protein